MNPRRLFGVFLLAALIASPGLAVAQGGPHQLTGVIQSVQGSSFTLAGGRTVFLHKGTIIRPTGIKLQPGMQVTVTGALAHTGHGAFNADEVDVARRHHM